jgi:hypothetical protein
MNGRGFFVLLPAALMAACAAGRSPAFEPLIHNEALAAAYSRYEQTMAQPRTPLMLESDKVVKTCRAYLASVNQAPVNEGVNNRRIAAEYAVCDTVAALEKAAANEFDKKPVVEAGPALYKKLDLRQFRSSLAQRLSDEAFTLAALDIGKADIDRHAVTVETDEWRYRLEAVASLDADGDGQAQWLVWFTDAAKKGNYFARSVLLVDGVTNQVLDDVNVIR